MKFFKINITPQSLILYSNKKISLKYNNMIKSQIWDTLGDEKFRNMTHLYFNDAQGAILPYNVTDLEIWKN